MISMEVARALQRAGVRWNPSPGDAFAIPDHDLDEDVFVLSDMVVQTQQMRHGPPLLAFNGTTEWALDSLAADEALWLPREDQLRALLGDTFRSLEAVEGEAGGYAVTLRSPSGPAVRHVDTTPEAAYARALLSLAD